MLDANAKSNEQHQSSAANTNSSAVGTQQKKTSRKAPDVAAGMGMSGWALFAKEKRLELLQSGQLTGETLPEQTPLARMRVGLLCLKTSCVAKFWHALSKDNKEAWGRRAEQLNRLAGGLREAFLSSFFVLPLQQQPLIAAFG
ncbi:myb-like DNA-binding high mobility group box domain-containing protein [Cyclospora cayetanensis]|uniref:Myb-like DNA-binding high mobility group box domain-containing protein n=1 Tax=Cyclospora cayetanensis TaxID=88456 RepID=A0A1D3D3B2_9EIME|nr:myb-like DNA-binding high mobility group box domain-containing protein [Cyclospora cayetanensis]